MVLGTNEDPIVLDHDPVFGKELDGGGIDAMFLDQNPGGSDCLPYRQDRRERRPA